MARNNAQEKRIARERIEILLEKSEEVFEEDRALAKRYVRLARRIGMRYNVTLPKQWKQRICKGCGTLLVPGANCRVRTRQRRVTLTCLECNSVKRMPFSEERKAQKGERPASHVSSLTGPP